ncbi:hypothetical protein LCGC14_1466450, partial [marine sediment metagenome]
FAAAFITPILLAFSLNHLYKKSVNKKAIVAIFVLGISFWLSAWWYHGDLGHKILLEKKKDHIDLYTLSPGFKKILKMNEESSENYRVLFLPAVLSPSFVKTKYQNKAQGVQPEYLYLRNPTFVAEFNSYASTIQHTFEKNVAVDYLNFLRLFSVKNIVLRSDVNPNFTESGKFWDSKKVKKTLDSYKWLEKYFEGEYEVGYRIKSKYFLPRIYSTTQLVFVSGKQDNVDKIASLNQPQDRKGFIFSESITKKQMTFILGKSAEFVTADYAKNLSSLKTVDGKYAISKDGKYEVFIYSNNKFWEKEIDYFSIKENGRIPIIKNVVSESSGWLSLGAMVLKKGNHKISFTAVDNNGKMMHMNETFIALRLRSSSLGDRPKVSFTRINPAKFRARVTDVTNPYLLVFSESFNSGWKAYHGRINWFQSLWAKPIAEDKHFSVNGYANAWYIDKQSDQDITLYYWPQTLFYIGLILSGLLLIGLLTYLTLDWLKSRTNMAGS